jgi:ankyrin repeat protein
VVELLLDEGAEIEARAPDGSTPLMMAAIRGSEQVVDLLLARGASTAPRDARGQRAVDRARGVGRDYLVKRLEPPR